MDMRYPERWMNDRRISRLTDAEHRAYVLALVWSVANRTDGVIAAEDLELMPKPVTREALDALARADLVTQQRTAGSTVWQLTEYATTQTTRLELESLEIARRARRETQRARRARSAVTGTALGQDRDRTETGQAFTEPPTESTNGNSWPVVSIPRSEPLPLAAGAEGEAF
jgi:hypothetical protein